MQIGIIGTGNIATGLAGRLVKAGHQVMFGSRSASKAQEAARRYGAQGGTQAEAVEFGDVIFLAIPFTSVQGLRQSLPGLRGKVVVETTNDWMGQSKQSTTAQIQNWLPDSKVVKAFNYTFAQILAHDMAKDVERPSAFIAGNDGGAKKTAAQVIESIGFDVVDVGSADDAIHLDHLVKFVVHLGTEKGYGTSAAFKLIKVY